MKTIRIQNRDSKFIAKLIWQELFNVYVKYGGNLSHMDNMLCDLSHIQQFVEKKYPFPFCWTFHQETGLTDIEQSNEPINNFQHCVNVRFSLDTISFIHWKPHL